MQKQVQILKQQEYVEEVDEEELSEREKLKRWLGRLKKLGIVITYSYHCNRCNHVWFPRDFDATFSSSITIGPDIAQYPRPKACARCKSRYWNLPPKRRTVYTTNKPGRFTQKELDYRDMIRSINPDKMNIFGHDMLTVKRQKSMIRKTIQAQKAMTNIERINEDTRLNGYDEKRANELLYNIKRLDPRSQRIILKKYGIDLDKK